MAGWCQFRTLKLPLTAPCKPLPPASNQSVRTSKPIIDSFFCTTSPPVLLLLNQRQACLAGPSLKQHYINGRCTKISKKTTTSSFSYVDALPTQLPYSSNFLSISLSTHHTMVIKLCTQDAQHDVQRFSSDKTWQSLKDAMQYTLTNPFPARATTNTAAYKGTQEPS